MVKFLLLSFVFLVLSGCTSASTALPTEIVPILQTPNALPVERTSEPTGISATPTVTVRVQPNTTSPVAPTVTPMLNPSPSIAAAHAPLSFSFPIGMPNKPLGDGFFIRHGAQVENTWYNPRYWHTGEDWYAIEGDTAGAGVYAIAAGEVVYAGSNYPGRVVIIRHADDLYSMYGHLDPDLNVGVGQQVERGTLLGTVLRRGDGRASSHLHFEVRTFLTAREVNGSGPRYGFRCGRNCPPGPGYWPIDAPDLPDDLGWRNPTHTINGRMLPEGAASEVIVASQPVSQSITLWSDPPVDTARQALDELDLNAGERFPLLEVRVGPEDTRETSALAYQLWYHIQLPDGRTPWVQAAVPSSFETGRDGRPSSVYFNFFPAIDTRI
jgi:murein DD-endopeptidase MepM/ murein hydrolase activator NlpD